MSITLLNEPKTTPSQPVERVLFTSGGTVTIKAPTDVVFGVITWFSIYNQWNSWTAELKFEESDAQVKAGCEGRLKSEMKDQGKSNDIPLKIGISFPPSDRSNDKADPGTESLARRISPFMA